MLGQALLELGLLDRATLDQAVTEQIIELRSALQSANRTLDRRVRERTEELQQALERLSELGEMKANFVANISHELRTPLTHIKGYLELLSSGSLGALTDDQQHALQVSQQGRRPPGEAHRGSVDVLTCLPWGGQLPPGDPGHPGAGQRARSMQLAPRLRRRAWICDWWRPNSMPLVQGDGEKILWVFNQLLDNAIKFTASGGHVMLGLKPESSNLVMVSVRDTGIGIAEQHLKEIFEPFRQLDGSSKRRAGGTGLGLALVRQIVEAHGSVLEVSSIEGQGTTFQFPLLVAAETQADGNCAEQLSAAGGLCP